MAFPVSPSNNDVWKEGNRSFVYDSTLGVWDQVKDISSVPVAPPPILLPHSSSNLVEGAMYYDSTSNSVKVRNASEWKEIRFHDGSSIATGGIITNYISGNINYKVHTFITSGVFTTTSSFNVEVLIVAGGGGGGIHSGGGGGAGGLLYYGAETPKTPNGSAIPVTPQTYAIVVGAGGASSGGPYNTVNGAGGSGAASSAFGYSAVGGGGGGSGGNGRVGLNGGSGGGGGRDQAAGSATTGTVRITQGFAGGYWGQGGSPYPGGGGGGAGAVGTGGGAAGGTGGVGLAYVIRSGSSTYYAGGGGGNLQNAGTLGQGGLGGGGDGHGYSPSIAREDGTINTGGGGGGGHYNVSDGGGAGGSGIVIIRYAL
jgi:hypothetical protein